MVLAFTLNRANNYKEFKSITVSYDNRALESVRIITEEQKLELYLSEYEAEIKFFANTFGISEETLLNKLSNDYVAINLLNTEENIGKVLINYLFALESSESDLFIKTITPCNKSKDYILSLINYFSNLYGNVDFEIAAAIAEVESGFSAPSMLNKNNVFGGMASGRLIGYKNIEYGILRYIKLLSEGYFAKGLTTVETIGRVYNPMYNEQGVKIAKPTWVSHVNNAMSNYQDILDITNVSEILTLQETQ